MATTYDLSQVSTPAASVLVTGDIINCPYTGSYKTITLPEGKYKLEVWGAQGGSYSSYYGGYGGYSYGELNLTEDTNLYLYAGGQGGLGSAGFNGGGTSSQTTWDGTVTYGCGGGGGSDIRIGGTALAQRVIVAGGGGGSASVNASTTKYGGGTTGGSPDSSYYGTQTAAGSGGSFGQGGNASTTTNYMYKSGGGGGGWYGGGASTNHSDASTAYRGYNGGGSGYIHTSTTAQSACTLSSQYYLTNAKTIAGNQSITDYSGSTTTGHSGNGAVRITVLKISSPLTIYIKTDSNTWKQAENIYIKTNSSTWTSMIED